VKYAGHPGSAPTTVAALLIAALAVPLQAQRQPAQTIHSIGWPATWQPYVAGQGLLSNGGTGAAAAIVGVHRPLMNPVSGLLGLSGEAYGATSGPSEGLGLRAMAGIPALGLRVGADWSVRGGAVDPIFNLNAAVRRGGLFGGGTTLRIDWLPTRGNTLGVGVSVPVMQPLAGRTRSASIAARLPATVRTEADAGDAVPAAAAEALREAGIMASRLGAYSSVYEDASLRRVLEGTGFEPTERRYFAAVARAFAAAAGDTTLGYALARRARAGLLHEVILPYDATFGRPKRGDLSGLTSRAQAGFERWTRDSVRLAGPARAAAIAVHARWLAAVERVHDELRDDAAIAHAVWLPLQLALAQDEYDEQAEVDSLLSLAVGRPFSDGNGIAYLRSSDLPLEIARSIYTTRRYHVLWTHDFTGRREKTNSIDEVGFSMVADAYLPALAAAVRRYDSTGTFPVYTILLDQYFSASRSGQLWTDILEDPLGADVTVEGDTSRWTRRLRERQRELREAVRASARLTSEANANGGERWLRRVVKVHVNVIYPSDFAFRSGHTVPPLPFTPDNIIRDHRKIVFYDLDEADPYRGAMLLMGVGIGEHYASATWEDRGYRVRGPAALEVRDAARRVLRMHGFRDEQIPLPLRPVADTTGTERRSDRGDYVGRALQVHNEVGAGRKESSVARALLYSLAAPASVVIAPDPLWLSAEWAGMLAGAAARGARVHVIAPAEENAPSPQAPLMALAHDNLTRLLELRRALAPRLAGGGELRLGLFTAQADVNDVAGRRREVREGLARAPWIRDLIPFDARALAVLDRAEVRSAADGGDATRIAQDERPRPPQLHQKTQLIARPGAIAALARQPGWEDVLAQTIETQSRQTANFAEQMTWTAPAVDEAATRRTDALIQGYERAIPEAERKRVSFHFSVGTQNHDPRGLLLDGEASMVTSGVHSSAGLVDLYYLMTRSTWIEREADLARHLPRKAGWLHWLARVVRPAL